MMTSKWKWKRFVRNNFHNPKDVIDFSKKFEIGQAIVLWGLVICVAVHNDFSNMSTALMFSLWAGAMISLCFLIKAKN